MENKIITIKKLENGKYFIDLHKYLISFLISLILIFPATYFPSKNLLFSVLSVIIFWILIAVIIDINDFFGKKVHYKIFEKKIFNNLLRNGFQIDKIDKYKGLITEKNGRTIRVFYNWNKTAERPLSFGDIEINIFYEPQIIESDYSKINVEKLKPLNKKYDKTLWSKMKRTMFTYDCLKICFNYYPWTKSEKIEQEISRGLQILSETDLKPFNLRNIQDKDLRQKEIDGFFYPNMQYIWELQEKNSR
ncbi:hypothetical protein [Epilithonimonas xixisoli]|uniref:Uncharacterized protein n=1 Tax=Epilithonimonas xixisoli TaxID=1476462 RepID=A0A4R8I4V4_9FLAO|nr:hypothetical protein [Epilithonimonas xixisoli]TDX83338.1 hypothetical protein B0I22_3418 [Epilithonimonas xixisoli]